MATVMVTFGSDTRSNDAITAGWIHNAIKTQDRLGEPICALVQVQGSGIQIILAAGSCPPGGRGRPPNAAETEVLDLYHRCHLDQVRFSPGEFEAFVRQVQHI